MMVHAIQCVCGDIIFSRANHDMRWCSCGKVAVDGGFSSYGGRIIGNRENWKEVTVEIMASQKELYNDWNLRTNKFGLIKGETHERT